MTVLTLALDPMHIIDHHGVASHILANSLFTLVYGWPDRPKTRCDLERMRSFHTHVHMHRCVSPHVPICVRTCTHVRIFVYT